MKICLMKSMPQASEMTRLSSYLTRCTIIMEDFGFLLNSDPERIEKQTGKRPALATTVGIAVPLKYFQQ